MTDSAVRSDNHKRRLGQHRCADCSAFRPFGTNCDRSAEPDPCPKCGSTAPASFKPRRVATSAAAAMPF